MKEIVISLPTEKIHINEVNPFKVIAKAPDGEIGIVVIDKYDKGARVQWSDGSTTPWYKGLFELVKDLKALIFYQL